MVRYSRTTANGLGTRKPKIFVLDTNVILHDYKAIRKFKDNDIVIPVAVVEELDKFKKGTDQLAYNARGFMRDMDRITDGRLFGKDGIPIAKGLGKIKIEPNHPFPDEMKDLFKDDIQDHRILSTAIWIRDNNPGRFVALVTKDINLRMKAKAAGMEVFGTFLGGENIYGAQLPKEGLIVMGNEAHGISVEVAAEVSRKITIPSFFEAAQGPESLNVAIATALTVSEFKRR